MNLQNITPGTTQSKEIVRPFTGFHEPSPDAFDSRCLASEDDEPSEEEEDDEEEDDEEEDDEEE